MIAERGLTRQQMKSLALLSDRKSAARLAGHLGLLLTSGTLIWLGRGSLLVAPALLLHGVLLAFLFAPLHESVHRTVFSNRRANDLLAFLLGLTLLLPPTYFRVFHREHHRFTQDPQRDPELSAPRPGSRLALLWHLSGLPYWTAGISGLLRQAAGRIDDPFIGPRDRPAVIREARLYLAVCAAAAAASLVLQSAAILWLWLLPALLGQPFLRVFLLSEHLDLPYDADMLANSRTTRTSAVVRWITWNMPYHAEHHAYPAIPFHALPEAHRQLGPSLPSIASGYLATTAVAWCRRPWRSAQT